jgi:hypothetical protein
MDDEGDEELVVFDDKSASLWKTDNPTVPQRQSRELCVQTYISLPPAIRTQSLDSAR